MCTLRFLKSCCLLKQRPFYSFMVNRTASSRNVPMPLINPEDEEEVDKKAQTKATEKNYLLDPTLPILRNNSSNIFFMPHEVGPAYHDLITTADHFAQVDNNTAKIKGGPPVPPVNEELTMPKIQIISCPQILTSSIKDIFTHPYGEFVNLENYTIMNLHFSTDVNSAIKAFVLKATQYSLAIIYKGFWADFVNPFTGRGYFRSGKCNKQNNSRFSFHNMMISQSNGCTIIEETEKYNFTGAIVTDVPLHVMEHWWLK